MEIEFDPAKHMKTLEERGLDFARADEVFAGVTVTAPDTRINYNEPRFSPSGCWMDDSWYWSGPNAAKFAALSA